jgi:hypothetical protein
MLYRRTGRGKTSGIEIAQLETKGAFVFHIHDGTVARMSCYWDRERALTDLGLKE